MNQCLPHPEWSNHESRECRGQAVTVTVPGDICVQVVRHSPALCLGASAQVSAWSALTGVKEGVVCVKLSLSKGQNLVFTQAHFPWNPHRSQPRSAASTWGTRLSWQCWGGLEFGVPLPASGADGRSQGTSLSSVSRILSWFWTLQMYRVGVLGTVASYSDCACWWESNRVLCPTGHSK